MNKIFKNAEECALSDGFDQVIAKNQRGNIFFTRLMGDITCSCVSKTDKVIGCVVVVPSGKTQFVRA